VVRTGPSGGDRAVARSRVRGRALNVALLVDVQTAFRERDQPEYLSSEEIIVALKARSERPWADWNQGPDLVQDHDVAATHALSSVALPHRRAARDFGLVGSASNTRPVADSRPKSERGVGVKTVSPAARGRSEVERLDADEHSPHDGRYAANGHLPCTSRPTRGDRRAIDGSFDTHLLETDYDFRNDPNCCGHDDDLNARTSIRAGAACGVRSISCARATAEPAIL
jgi:hypothetical protein